MTKLAAFSTEACLSCNHFKFCLVYWGTQCKRQGGKRTPRLRSMSVKLAGKTNNQVRKRTEKPKPIFVNTIEPIRTKAVIWK